MNLIKTQNAWVVAVVLVCWLPALAQADETKSNARTPTDMSSLKALEARVHAAAKKVSSAVVAVEIGMKSNVPGPKHHEPTGSGVRITADGLILSQYHVSHMTDPSDFMKSRKPGEKVMVILHDGRRVAAELLGADRAYDLSLLRLVKPGPYPHAPLDDKVGVKLGDWLVKVGHPLGYRPGRAPVVRLGRVLCRQDDSFVGDCLVSGGDSGGPFFDLDGRLVGIIRNSGIPEKVREAGASSRRVAVLFAASSNALIQKRLDAMQRGEFVAVDEAAMKRSLEAFNKAEMLPAGQWTQGEAVRKAYRAIANNARAGVVTVLNGDEAVALGTVVGADGWVVTKASQLPAEPRCRLPEGRVVAAEVIGIDPAFDLALLKVPATDLRPVEWAEKPDPVAGTFLATPGPRELLAVGVVSVQRRDLPAPYPTRVDPPRKVPAGLPEVIGSAVQGRGYWVEYVEGKMAEAGVRPGDVILTIAGKEVRRHTDLAECVRGLRAGERMPVRVIRAGKQLDFTLSIPARGGAASISVRADDYPTLFEHDVPTLDAESGGPVVDLTGKALGITIARVDAHGCMAIPGDCVQRVVADLKSGKGADQWAAYRKALVAQTKPPAPATSKPGRPVTLTLEELKKKLKERGDRFESLLVEYDLISEAHVEPRLLVAWNMHHARDYQERHRIAFAGAKRYTQVLRPEVLARYAPADQVTADPKAPLSVAQTVERQRRNGEAQKQQGYSLHLFLSTHAEEVRSVYDGGKCFLWSEYSKRLVPARPEDFYAPIMYLANLGLRPVDPRPGAERRKQQEQFWFPDNFASYEECRILPREEAVDGAPCVVIEAKRHAEWEGKRHRIADRIWFDPKLGYAPRKWEQREDGILLGVRTNKEFDELAPNCWLPWECIWTLGTPAWVAPELRDRPAYSYHMRLRKARINDVSDTLFHP